MSCYTIYYNEGAKMMRPVTSRDEYLQLRGSKKQETIVADIRKGNEKMKHHLLQMNYSCMPNRPSPQPSPVKGEGVDTNTFCGPLKGSITPSNSVGMDVDLHRDDFATEEDYQKALAEIPEKVLAKKDELGLLMLERSATKGYHLVFKRKAELSQEDNLRWASNLLGVEYDQGAKDITRVFFTTTASEEDLLYLSDELFIIEAMDATRLEGDTSEAVSNPVHTERSGGCAGVGAPSHNMCLEGTTSEGGEQGTALQAGGIGRAESPSTPPSSVYPVTDRLSEAVMASSHSDYDGIPYTAIIEALENQLGGVPAHGSRNQFIFSMACHLRYICNDDPEWIAEVLPTYGEGREKWMATIKSACNRSQNKTMPKILKKALEIGAPLRLPRGGETGSYCSGMPGSVLAVSDCDSNNSSPRGGWEGAPAMPSKLPPLVKLLISKTPKIYQPAVAHAIFPALATHLWKTRFKYIDNVEHEATLMNVLMAGTGAGKNCIAEPIRFIMKDIVERDQINREKERQWKEEMQTKGSNKDKKKRPEGLIIQNVKPDMTNAAFVQRMKEAEEHFLYTQMNEIDQFDALKTSARSKSQFQIMCLAFDPQNSYGTERVGTASVSETVCVRFNWNASTTIQKGKAYFAKVLTDGPISRINSAPFQSVRLAAKCRFMAPMMRSFRQS